MMNKWISVKDRLPETWDNVLCWYEYIEYDDYEEIYHTYGIGFYAKGRWRGEITNKLGCRVIAWMPLPEPPIVKEN